MLAVMPPQLGAFVRPMGVDRARSVVADRADSASLAVVDHSMAESNFDRLYDQTHGCLWQLDGNRLRGDQQQFAGECWRHRLPP
jgi:hypothetical protein